MTKAGYIGGFALITATLMAATTLPADAHGRERGGQGERGAAMFERFDANSDGSVTLDEMNAARDARFAEADADGDGALTVEEIVAFMEAQREERASRRAARGAERMIERLDSDDNGTLSVEEAGALPMRMFERLDADDDGAVTKAELEAAGDHMRERRGEGRRGDHKGRGHGAPWWMPAD
ncbi:EF-hand domain-containing protein [Cognatishimia sp. F0-27]|uniref:EF-hand domain-containing protein n=1 Tax=Cognatishimia sp. F0-27 TaxID=2816855 RepID=UPI001D0C762C|nr:EF-hand domain-containing protein [Cognatishimia sp. F0-27]MCC1492182.1 EF-hand domain-containing protein [Cognatishimia sp. F0-27]